MDGGQRGHGVHTDGQTDQHTDTARAWSARGGGGNGGGGDGLVVTAVVVLGGVVVEMWL